MCSPSGHPRLGWVCFFIRFGEMSQEWMLCSEWVPSEWESKQLIKTSNNPQVIHTIPVHQLTSREDKSWNKSIVKTFVTKYDSIINNNASSSEKVFLVWAGDNLHRSTAFTRQNSCKQICGWILMWETTGMHFFTARKRYYDSYLS